MSPTAPDPALPDQDAPDEVLGEQLDRHLEWLARGGLSAAPSSAEGELPQLQQVVERLFRLAQGLSTPTTISHSGTPPASTVDFPGTPGQDTSQEPSPRRQEPAPGEPAPPAVGKFRVVRALGQGGQASTLLAFDPDLKRHVVLKLYHAARTPEEQELVLREGQALARVRSPYVAQCHSAERDRGVPFLVMEYIPGRNLADEHRARPLSTDEALDVVSRLAEGLAAVHACGLLHRDVKPGNVLIGEDGRPRLVDFGLAAPLASADLSHLSGTLAYMAPEQARGQVERIDARTDLYGLGAVLYDLLTGRPPHTGATRPALLAAARAGDVEPVNKFNPQVPPAVHELCLRCLARDPVNRFASASELAEAIRRLRQPSRRRWPLLAAAGAGVTAAVVLLVVLVSGSGSPDAGGSGTEANLSRGKGGPEAKSGAKADAGPVWVEPEGGVRPAYLKGRKLRHDFPLRVEIIDSVLDPEGKYRLTLDRTVSPDPKTHILHRRHGQILRLRIHTAEDAWVGVWDVLESQNKVYRLFPNRKEQDNLIEGGRGRLVPRAQDLRASAKSEGVEYVHVVASTWPFRKLEIPDLRHQLVGPFTTYTLLDAYERMTRVLRDLELVPEQGQLDEPSDGEQGQTVRELLGTARPRRISEVMIPLRVLRPGEGE
jgi:hypothetical protein